MKLILCAGDRKLEGFTTHDIQGKQDILCDFWDIGKHVEHASCEEIHFTHALEHFPTAQTALALDNIYGLLKEGGKLYLEVPNFAFHARLVFEGEALSNPEEQLKKHRLAVYYAFGGQLDEYDFHKTAFTYSILRAALEEAGFKDIQIQDASSLSAWATK